MKTKLDLLLESIDALRLIQEVIIMTNPSLLTDCKAQVVHFISIILKRLALRIVIKNRRQLLLKIPNHKTQTIPLGPFSNPNRKDNKILKLVKTSNKNWINKTNL